MTNTSPVAFISGASGGIGQEISLRLAARGYHLILHYFKNEEVIRKLKTTVEQQYSRTCTLIQADFTNVTETMNKIISLNVKPEVIVHNCATTMVSLFQDVKEAELISQTSLGLVTPSLITKAFLPPMIANKKGKIILITSIWGLTGASCEVIYSMIKGGQNSFVKALAKEVAFSGIQVNGIAPGAISTDMLKQYSVEEIAALESEIPAGRLGSPIEIAAAVEFLASSEANYINGQILSINGAWYC